MHKKIISGVYKIENKINHKIYIGGSCNCRRRKYEHFRLLKLNIHRNERLQEEYNKYGKENFRFKLMKKCSREDLKTLESFYIEKLKSYKKSFRYNLYRLVKGNTKPKSTKEKLSLANTGKVMSLESRNKMSIAKKGCKVSKETIEKRRKSRAGYRPSEETREKMSKARIGHKPSLETRKKMSISATGRKLSDETKRKVSIESKKRFGWNVSRDTKNKISETLKIKNLINPRLRDSKGKFI
jgi:group I intron endonuclease